MKTSCASTPVSELCFWTAVAGEQLTELLTNAALFVLPSDLEGLSLALLDAMGAGVCVLASDLAENREVIGDAGFTFRAGNVDDLAEMLALLASDPDIRAAAGRMAKRVVEERYLWPGIASEIREIYEELIGPNTGVSAGLRAREAEPSAERALSFRQSDKLGNR